jgi:hypothetical protein
MPKKLQKFATGFELKKKLLPAPAAPAQLFGHVILIQAYAIPTYNGIHALISLRDTPGKIIAVFTTQARLQTVLETGLSTGNLVAVDARPIVDTPLGGGWTVDTHAIDSVILYSFK